MLTRSRQRLVRCVEHDIAVHTHVKPVTNRDFDCGLNVQILARDLGAKAGDLLSNGAARRFRQGWDRSERSGGPGRLSRSAFGRGSNRVLYSPPTEGAG